MLTGDKLETAENIARSCNLILRNFEVLRISEQSPEQIQETMKTTKEKFQALCQKNTPKALLIEGEALGI